MNIVHVLNELVDIGQLLVTPEGVVQCGLHAKTQQDFVQQLAEVVGVLPGGQFGNLLVKVFQRIAFRFYNGLDVFAGQAGGHRKGAPVLFVNGGNQLADAFQHGGAAHLSQNVQHRVRYPGIRGAQGCPQGHVVAGIFHRSQEVVHVQYFLLLEKADALVHFVGNIGALQGFLQTG